MEDSQRILVFQQNGSGEAKIEGIRRFGGTRFSLRIVNIDNALPPVVDDADTYLPSSYEADLVLDFLKHPDISYDLALRCHEYNIPLVASGKKHHIKGVLCPPT